jgi:hypothetical protein
LIIVLNVWVNKEYQKQNRLCQCLKVSKRNAKHIQNSLHCFIHDSNFLYPRIFEIQRILLTQKLLCLCCWFIQMVYSWLLYCFRTHFFLSRLPNILTLVSWPKQCNRLLTLSMMDKLEKRKHNFCLSSVMILYSIQWLL